jgi:phosphohistidine swiveling domain-containing protein
VLRITLGQAAANELPQTVLLAIPDVVSAGPVHALWELSRRALRTPALRRALMEQPPRRTYEALQQGAFPEFKPAFDDYIARFGFRVSGELMLTTRSYVEEPERLLEALVPYLEIEGPSPEVTTAHQAKQRDVAVRDVRARLTWPARTAFDAALHATQAGIRLRERARLKQAHLYCQFRQVVGALGARLQQEGKLERADDLLYLRWREIDDWLSGHELLPGAIKPLIALRRRVYAEQARLFADNVPPTVRLRVGDYLTHAAPADDAPADGDSLQGLGVAGGQARGRARVLRHAHEQAEFQSGECLVTEQTDPGWAPLFFRAAGLVMERGGMLSHGAIVAREFGIPAVVAARGATQLVHTGDYLEIDGNAGLVRKLGATERSPGAG